MRKKIWIASALLLSLAGFLLAGCAPSATVSPTLPPTTQPTAIPTKPPTAEPTPVPSATPYAMPAGPDAVWTLVVIGDSSMWEHGKAFAEQIQQDLGVTVALEDFALPALSAGTVRKALETGKSPNARLGKLPDAVREAEVVVMFTNPNDSISEGKPDIEACFYADPPGTCSADFFAGYRDDLQAIWAKVIELRAGQPTILIGTDIYSPLLAYWEAAGVAQACDVCWSNMSAANRAAAEALRIPFVSRYDLFNGAGHNENPVDKGWIRSDGEHPSELGAIEAAKLFARIGYEPYQPPE